MTTYNIAVKVDPKQALGGIDRVKKGLLDLEGRADSVGKTFGRIFSGLSAAFAIQQLVQYADAFTGIQNGLRATGVAQAELNKITEQNFDIANRTLQPAEAIGTLYRRAGIAAKELSASQEELARFTETVGNTLRIQGSSAAAASGALNQLGQALGSGTVRAEEFNSILEGAFPLAQAAAAGIDRAAGSVSRLRQLVITGQISSEEFFNAILSQSDNVAAKLENVVVSVGQAITVLNNNLIEYVGNVASSSGVSQALAQAILLLGNNLEIAAGIAQVLAVSIGVALAAKAIPAAIAGVTTLTAVIAANPFGALAVGITAAITALFAFEDKIEGSTAVITELTDTVLAVVDVAVEGFLAMINSVSPFEVTLEDLGNAFKFLGQVAQGIIRGIIVLFDFARASARAFEAALLDPLNAASAANAAFQANIGQTFNAFQKAYDTRQTVRAREDLRKKIQETQDAIEKEANAAEAASLIIDKGTLRRIALLDEIKGPIEKAKRELSDLNILFKEGKITVEQYEKAKAPLLKTISSTTSATTQAVATFQSEIDKLKEANVLLQVQGLERESLNNILSIQDALKRKLTETEKAQVIELTKTNKALEAQSQILESIKGPPEEARINLNALNQLFADGKITVDEYNRAYGKFAADLASFDTSATGGMEQYFRNLQATALTTADTVRMSFEATTSAMSGFFEEFANTGKLNFKSFADDVLKQINRIAAQALSQQVAGLFGGIGSQSGGSIFSSLFGGGGGNILGGFLPGFATGGSFNIGGMSGVDNNVLSLNNKPIAKVSKGETVNIDNEGGSGKPVQVIMNIQTQDANSFRASEGQIMSRTAAALSRARQRNR